MRRQPSTLEISMFPFLSVLCSLIGVMMLLLVLVMVTRTVAASGPPCCGAPGSAGGGGLNVAEQEQVRAELAALAARLAERQKELAALLTQRELLQELLAVHRDRMQLEAGAGLLTGADLDPEEHVDLVAHNPHERPKPPRFLEVSLDGYIVHPDLKSYAVADIPLRESDIGPDTAVTTPLQKFLEELHRQRQRSSLVLLVRPNGIASFQRIYSYLCAKYPHPQSPRLSQIDLGWEPFDERWTLISKKLKP